MGTSPTRTRSFVALGLVLALVAALGAGIWLLRGRSETRSPEKLCARLAPLTTLSSAFVTLDPTTLGPQVSELQRAADVAPKEIRADLDVLATFVEEVADAVRAAPVDKKAALTAALADRQDRIDAVTAAGRSVDEWSTNNCGAPLRTSTTQRSSTTRR